jgi:hypothetical protein
VIVLAAIDFGQLRDVIGISLAAGVIVTTAFAFVVLESARSSVARRSGRDRLAVVHATLAVLMFAAFASIVTVGIVIMLRK